MTEALPLDEHAHKLTREEDAAWKRTKDEWNTYEDWVDLNATIIAYRRRRIARHLATPTQCALASAKEGK